MKKTIVIATLFILFALGVYLGPLLFAQERAAVNTQPKVAMVNVRAVFKENARAKALQAELEETLKPHKLRAEGLTKEIDALSASKTPNPVVLAKKRAEWEIVNGEILRTIEKKHEERLPAVWREVHETINALAKAYGFQLVLGYGDPDDPEVSKLLGARASKLRTADMGGTVAGYVHDSIDLTPIVIQMLQPRVAPKRP